MRASNLQGTARWAVLRRGRGIGAGRGNIYAVIYIMKKTFRRSKKFLSFYAIYILIGRLRNMTERKFNSEILIFRGAELAEFE